MNPKINKCIVIGLSSTSWVDKTGVSDVNNQLTKFSTSGKHICKPYWMKRNQVVFLKIYHSQSHMR